MVLVTVVGALHATALTEQTVTFFFVDVQFATTGVRLREKERERERLWQGYGVKSCTLLLTQPIHVFYHVFGCIKRLLPVLVSLRQRVVASSAVRTFFLPVSSVLMPLSGSCHWKAVQFHRKLLAVLTGTDALVSAPQISIHESIRTCSTNLHARFGLSRRLVHVELELSPAH